MDKIKQNALPYGCKYLHFLPKLIHRKDLAGSSTSDCTPYGLSNCQQHSQTWLCLFDTPLCSLAQRDFENSCESLRRYDIQDKAELNPETMFRHSICGNNLFDAVTRSHRRRSSPAAFKIHLPRLHDLLQFVVTAIERGNPRIVKDLSSSLEINKRPINIHQDPQENSS